MSTYARLVPLVEPPEERQAIIDDVIGLYGDLQEQGANPVAEIRTLPDGDEWVITFDDEDVPAAA